MNCCEIFLHNTGNTITYFNYRKCDDGIWYYQNPLKRGMIKQIWAIGGTYSTAFHSINVISEVCTEIQITPTLTTYPTPTPSVTVPPTPTPTPTPSPTPDENLLNAIITQNDEYTSIGEGFYLKFIDP